MHNLLMAEAGMTKADKQKLLEQLEQLRIEQTQTGDFYHGLTVGNNLAVDMIQIIVGEL